MANDFQSGRKAEKSDIRVPILSELMEKHALQPENFLIFIFLYTFAIAMEISEDGCKDTKGANRPTIQLQNVLARKYTTNNVLIRKSIEDNEEDIRKTQHEDHKH